MRPGADGGSEIVWAKRGLDQRAIENIYRKITEKKLKSGCSLPRISEEEWQKMCTYAKERQGIKLEIP